MSLSIKVTPYHEADAWPATHVKGLGPCGTLLAGAQRGFWRRTGISSLQADTARAFQYLRNVSVCLPLSRIRFI